MEKLVERETAPRTSLTAAPALAVQFFLIPLAVVGITILVYVGFRSLLTDQRSAQDYLAEVQSGGLARQWPAACVAGIPFAEGVTHREGELQRAVLDIDACR